MENFYQNIERYLLGELAGGALTAFENAMQSDPALAKSVAQHREMMLRLDALRLRNKVKSATASQRVNPTSINTQRVFMVIAALLVLLAASFWFSKQFSESRSEKAESQPQTTQPDTLKTPPNQIPTPIPDEFQPKKPTEKPKGKPQLIALAREFHDQPSQTFVRDAAQQAGDTSPKTQTQRAADAFYNQNFRLAAELLKDDKQVMQDEGARYIRANARFNIGQFSGAAKDFDALKDSFQFRHEARWNFLLCQIALGNIETAKNLLAKMVEEDDFPFRAKALKLQGEIILNF
ncbi:MAG: hypothetical protein H7246_17220 [Phycisphaerae bacterium]|nr:hypothetical protein [Saprospiraceae bacterium]